MRNLVRMRRRWRQHGHLLSPTTACLLAILASTSYVAPQSVSKKIGGVEFLLESPAHYMFVTWTAEKGCKTLLLTTWAAQDDRIVRDVEPGSRGFAKVFTDEKGRRRVEIHLVRGTPDWRSQCVHFRTEVALDEPRT